MPERPSLLRLALLSVALAALGCGLVDLFQPSGLDDVSFTYVGPTTVRVGDSLPFTVTVRAGGGDLPDAPLRFGLGAGTALRLSSAHDALVALSVGHDTLRVWLEYSIVTDARPHFLQEIRVQGGPPFAPHRLLP